MVEIENIIKSEIFVVSPWYTSHIASYAYYDSGKNLSLIRHVFVKWWMLT